MNTELEKTFSFPCVLVGAETGPWINRYEVCIEMRVLTDEGRDYNIAYQRMKFWFYDIMHSAVLIHSEDAKLQAWRDTGMSCLDFPQNPVDQIVGLMLMSKLTAIVEGRLEILRVGISSAEDDFVTYFCDQTDHLHWFEESGWWRDPGPNHTSQRRRSRTQGKVISINRGTEWKDHDLDWPVEDNNVGNVSILPVRGPDAPE